MPEQPARLLHITDTHLLGRPDARLRGLNTHDSLRRVLEAALAASPPPDAILATGDLVQDDGAGYEPFRDLLARPGLPVLCLPGNHDVPVRMREALAGPPFLIGGHVDLGAWRIVLLDSVVAGTDGGQLATEELARLDRLVGETDRHVLIALHHQPVAMGSRWLDEVGLGNAADLLAIVDRQPRVRGIVWGHVHQASDRWRKDILLMSTPSTCDQFTPGAHTFAIDDRPAGYRWLELCADGRIHTQVIWVD